MLNRYKTIPIKLICAPLMVLIFAFSANSVSSSVTKKDIEEITRVCMFSEGAMQDYVLIGLGAEYGNPKEALKEKLATIEKFINDVYSHDMSKESHESVGEVKSAWAKIKPLFAKEPTKDNVQVLRKLIDEFAHRCEELDEQLAKELGSEEAHEVVLISDLGVDVQKIAVIYLMRGWGAEIPDYDEEAKHIIKAFDKAYNELINANDKVVPVHVKEKLKVISKHFLVFRMMATSKSGRFVPTMAQSNSEKILGEVFEILEIEEALIK